MGGHKYKCIIPLFFLFFLFFMQGILSLLAYLPPQCKFSVSLSCIHRFLHVLANNLRIWGINCSPTFLKIMKVKSVEDFKPDPYVATVLNCAMWCFYGFPFVHPDSFLVITINGCGLIIEIIYVTIFFLYSPWSKRVSKISYHIEYLTEMK